MTTTVFTIVDLLAGRVKLLENGDTEEFNSLRKEFKHQTTKYSLNERVDLYINLIGENLESSMIYTPTFEYREFNIGQCSSLR